MLKVDRLLLPLYFSSAKVCLRSERGKGNQDRPSTARLVVAPAAIYLSASLPLCSPATKPFPRTDPERQYGPNIVGSGLRGQRRAGGYQRSARGSGDHVDGALLQLPATTCASMVSPEFHVLLRQAVCGWSCSALACSASTPPRRSLPASEAAGGLPGNHSSGWSCTALASSEAPVAFTRLAELCAAVTDCVCASAAPNCGRRKGISAKGTVPRAAQGRGLLRPAIIWLAAVS